MNSKAFFQLSYGLFVAATTFEGKTNGCIINTVTQVADNPKQLIISVNKQNYTCELVQKSGIFSISVLSESAPFSLFEQFGFQSGRETDKFAGVSTAMTKQNLPYLTEHTNAYFDCKVINSFDLGSHIMFLAEVVDADVLSNEKSMTYAYYHANVKPQKAPVAQKGWRCIICGYIYEGEELPPDFVCPICKHGAEDFEKIL